jgi:hypothetical protein
VRRELECGAEQKRGQGTPSLPAKKKTEQRTCNMTSRVERTRRRRASEEKSRSVTSTWPHVIPEWGEARGDKTGHARNQGREERA